MKTCFISVLAICISIGSLASDKPEPIEFKTKVIHPASWYSNQADLWRAVATSDNNAQAWLNYYLASRYAQAPREVLNDIAIATVKNNPGTFEAFLLQGWELGMTPEGFALIEKAYQLNHDRIEVLPSMTLAAEFLLDKEDRAHFSKRMLDYDMVSSSLLAYCYNVLMSIEDNAILFTEGENITIPIFILQDVFNIRPDVRILNLDLLMSTAYRDSKLKSTGLKLDNFTQSENETEGKKRLCAMLPEQNPDNKFYYSLTLTKQNTSDIKDQLYVVGLASKVSKTRLDNLSALRNNLENRFLLDHLTVDFEGESTDAAGKVLGVNYLVPMLLLAEYYQKAGDKAQLDKWQSIIMKLAQEHDKTLVVQNFLKKESVQSTRSFVAAGINVKALEPSFLLVKDNIYALRNELTIDDYDFFLKYLQDNKMQDVYNVSKVDLSKYTDVALAFMKGYHARKVSKKIRNSVFPIINISYEGAVAYCDWLTEQYNNDPKRKYKRVKFRLPTVNEWQIAALGYKKAQSWTLEENTVVMAKPENPDDEICKNCPENTYLVKDSDIRYPWYYHYNYRNRVLNTRGCALGNFKFPDTQKPCRQDIPSVDGFATIAGVQCYFPNGIGLYDVVGNVAEMTSEKGKACGGSWNHPPEESTISSINPYEGPDSDIGFRPFMEVIEE